MSMWQERSITYKVGFAGVNLATLMFIVAFCAPSWALFRLQPNEGHHHTQSLGLWQVCTKDLSICKLALHSENPGWLKAVRALECIAMFFAVASCFVGLYSNCILKAQLTSNIFNKNMETSAIVSVAFAFFGLIMFASQIEKYYTRYSTDAGHVWWGFVMASVATALLAVSAGLMLLAHKLRLLAEMRGSRGTTGQFAHRQFSNSSFHSNVRLPDYSESSSGQVFISNRSGECGVNIGSLCTMPPAYETVVSCGGTESRESTGMSEGPSPPSYSEVVASQLGPPSVDPISVDSSNAPAPVEQ